MCVIPITYSCQAHCWRFFLRLTPTIIVQFCYNFVSSGKQCFNSLWKIHNRTRLSQSWHFWSSFVPPPPPATPWRWPKQKLGIGLSKYVKIFSPFSGRNKINFCQFLFIFGEKQGGAKGLRVKIKKSLVPPFSIFAALDAKGHFIKTLACIFEFGCFFRNCTQTCGKKELDILIQNLMLNRLAPISISKNQIRKSLCVLF